MYPKVWVIVKCNPGVSTLFKESQHCLYESACRATVPYDIFTGWSMLT